MLMTEWNWDDALAVRYEEGREQGIEQGREQGIEQGREEGIEHGIEKTARNALAQGFSFEVIQSLTGLDLDTIKNLEAK